MYHAAHGRSVPATQHNGHWGVWPCQRLSPCMHIATLYAYPERMRQVSARQHFAVQPHLHCGPPARGCKPHDTGHVGQRTTAQSCKQYGWVPLVSSLRAMRGKLSPAGASAKSASCARPKASEQHAQRAMHISLCICLCGHCPGLCCTSAAPPPPPCTHTQTQTCVSCSRQRFVSSPAPHTSITCHACAYTHIHTPKYKHKTNTKYKHEHTQTHTKCLLLSNHPRTRYGRAGRQPGPWCAEKPALSRTCLPGPASNRQPPPACPPWRPWPPAHRVGCPVPGRHHHPAADRPAADHPAADHRLPAKRAAQEPPVAGAQRRPQAARCRPPAAARGLRCPGALRR